MSEQSRTPGERASWQRALTMRRAITEQLSPPPLAWSADGREFGFRCSVDHDIVPGDFVTLTTPDGVVRLGQLRSKRVDETDGSRITIDPGLFASPGAIADGGTASAASVDSFTVPIRMRTATGDGEVLGRLSLGDNDELGATEPFDEALIEQAPAKVVADLVERIDQGRATTVVGAISAAGEPLPARIRVAGFNRHTFVCGQSGSGKTFALGVILERLITQTALRIIVLDPNGDFVRVGEIRDDASVDRSRRLPAMAGESESFRRRHSEVAPQIAVHSSAGVLRPCVRLVDMSPAAQAAILRLDPLTDRREYAEAITQLERLREAIEAGSATGGADLLNRLEGSAKAGALGDPAVDELTPVQRDLMLRISNLGLGQWSVWAGASPSVVDSIVGGARVTVADLGALATDEERAALSLGVLEHLWSQRDARIPTLIVIDEAHTVVPTGEVDPVRAMARELVIRIAGEGRKFGLFLMVASQRPDKVHANVLTQCDNLVLMRMNAAADIEALVGDFSFVPAPMIRQSRFFEQGEAVVAGPIVHGPTLLRFGGRYTAEGGSDLPTTWAQA